jgi:hypothetical protein
MQAPTLEEMRAAEAAPAEPAPRPPVVQAAVWRDPRPAPPSALDPLAASKAGLATSGPPALPQTRSRGLPLVGWIGIGVAALAAVAIVAVMLMRGGGKGDSQIAADENAAPRPMDSSPASPVTTQRSTNEGAEKLRPQPPPVAVNPADADRSSAATSEKNKTNEAPPVQTITPPATSPATQADAGDTSKAAVPTAKRPPRANEEVKGPPLTAWTARPDPRAAEEQASLSTAKWAEIDLPVLDQQRAIFYPRRQSTFVGVFGAASGKQYVGSINFADGKRKGPFVVRISDPNDLVMSADRAHFAAKGGGFRDPTVHVFSFENGEAVQTLRMPEQTEVLWYDFADDGQLVISSRARGIDRRPKIDLWSIEDGQHQRSCEIVEREGIRDIDSLVVSPGGRYLAFTRAEVLAIVDLANGKCAGEVRIPSVGDFGGIECTGLAFSPGGGELAALATQFGKTYVVVLDVATGKFAGEPVQPHGNYAGGFRRGPRIDWFADQGLLIDNRALFHRQLLHSPVYEFPDTQDRRKLLDWRTAAVVERDDASRTTKLRTVSLPSDMFAKRIEVLRAGGDLVDADLPKLTKADLGSMKDLASTPPAETWQYTPHPVLAGDARSPLLLASSAAPAHVEQWRVASPNHAVLLRRLLDAQSEGKRIVERYDLATGRLDGSGELLLEMSVVDFSADGEFVLFKAGKARERLDLMSLAGKEHIAGWRPYAEFPEPATSEQEKRDADLRHSQTLQHDDRTRSYQAFVIDREHVVTMNFTHGIVAWKLPECRAIYRRKAAPKVAVSACRNYLAVPMTGQTKGIEVVEAKTGQSCGLLPAELNSLDSFNTQIAFRADGKALALVQNRVSHTLVKTFDLSGGTSASAVLPPLRFTGSLSWCGENHLVVDGVLIDVARGAAVWKYEAAGGLQFSGADEAWTMTFAGARAAELHRVPIPTPQSRDQLAQVTPLVPAFGPGMKLSVSAGVSVPGVNQDALVQLIATDLARRGFSIDENAPVRLTLQASEQSTGRTLEYRRIGRGQTVTINEMAIDVQAVLNLPNGQQRTVHKHRVGMSGGMMEQGENLEARLQDQMRRAFLRHAEHIPMPEYVFNDFAEAAVPRSVLNGDQEEIHPPMPTPEDQRKRFEGSQ